MADLKYYDVILRPVITEKSMNVMSEKKYTFFVHTDATKTQIKEERKKNINKINELINDYYNSIAENNDKVKINYTYNDIDESEYLRCLENDFEKDKITGYTNFGIHKDNYIFNFNQVDASGVASRGEIRSIILALKFIEARLLFEESKQKPLILLDDVFSELDNKRQKCLVQNFKDHQVILTSVNGVEF